MMYILPQESVLLLKSNVDLYTSSLDPFMNLAESQIAASLPLIADLDSVGSAQSRENIFSVLVDSQRSAFVECNGDAFACDYLDCKSLNESVSVSSMLVVC